MPQAGSLRPRAPGVNAFRAKCRRGGSRGTVLAFAALVEPGSGWELFWCAPPTFSGNWHRDKKFKESVSFQKKKKNQLEVRPVQLGNMEFKRNYSCNLF